MTRIEVALRLIELLLHTTPRGPNEAAAFDEALAFCKAFIADETK